MRLLVTGGSGFIGTNYVDAALRRGFPVRNVDRNPPQKPSHQISWTPCDLSDLTRLQSIIAEFAPTHIVHLAAVTGIHGSPSQFEENRIVTENLLAAIKACDSVTRVVITSSTLVCEIGYVPESDTDYRPTTPYGASKVAVERTVRRAKELGCDWTIIRPVSIWGPWFEEPYRNFFEAIEAGWYCHVGYTHIEKSLGYVENTVEQIQEILEAPSSDVHGKTLYLADYPPVTLQDFAESIRRQLSAPRLWYLPVSVARGLATVGDVLRKVGWRSVPLTTFRLNNILTEYVYDVSPIMEIAGAPRYSLDDGVRRTVEWLEEYAW